MSENHGNLDILLRIRINEIIGYKMNPMSMYDIFKELGKGYNNRQEYNQIMGIINKDRNDFCKEIWKKATKHLVDHSNIDYKILYRKCLENWYKQNRTLLYDLGKGWGTPLDYNTFKKIEEIFARRDAQILVNKKDQLELANIELPYKKPIEKLDNELKEDRKLLEDKEDDKKNETD